VTTRSSAVLAVGRVANISTTFLEKKGSLTSKEASSYIDRQKAGADFGAGFDPRNIEGKMAPRFHLGQNPVFQLERHGEASRIPRWKR